MTVTLRYQSNGTFLIILVVDEGDTDTPPPSDGGGVPGSRSEPVVIARPVPGGGGSNCTWYDFYSDGVWTHMACLKEKPKEAIEP